ncbi:MAG: glycosyltransferase family protein [Planctomycetota bacterium]|jgi:hypothetical protein
MTTQENNKPFKLGVTYNLFDGEELLPYSIKTIRESVDHINVVYQLISNHGNRASEDLEVLLKSLLDAKWIDEIYYYDPLLYAQPRQNEVIKRNIGLQIAKRQNCTHFMNMDTDEFYRRDEFNRAIDFIKQEDIGCSAVPIVSYIKEPIYRIEGIREAYVPFICKIDNSSAMKLNDSFPVLVDPTRRVSGDKKFHLFSDQEISMHHMGLVRRDLDKKFSNSSSKNIQILQDHTQKWEYGKNFRYRDDSEELRVSKVKNEFDIDMKHSPIPISGELSRKRLLLTNHHLENISGSEVTTLEMALVFKELGYDLHVATFSYGEPIQKCFKDNGIKVFNVLESALPYSEYDIAWCHHSPVLSHIVKQGVRLKNVILRTLSPYEPLEALPAYVDAVDIVLANSEETAERYYSEGWIKKEKIEVFPNSVLSDFFNESRLRQNQAISRIAVVSNHVPDELKKAVEIIRSRSVIVDILGRGGTPKLVTPDVLKPYDLIITIGKTVQFCFAMRIPVYCYDRFGGPYYEGKL